MHPFEAGRTLYLAGLEWPGETGLAGHSDGDAAAHAACDALLSAAGLGDLGAHFGTSRPQWAGAPGGALLRETARLVTAAGYVMGNLAICVIGNRPKIGPRRAEAVAVLSEALSGSVCCKVARSPAKPNAWSVGPTLLIVALPLKSNCSRER